MFQIYFNSKMNIYEVCSAFNDYKKTISDLDIENIWSHYSCDADKLKTKSEKLLTKLGVILKANLCQYFPMFYAFDCCVNFENVSENGKSIDKINICDINTENTRYIIIPKSAEGTSQLWSIINDFSEPIVNGTWSDVKNYFKGN